MRVSCFIQSALTYSWFTSVFEETLQIWEIYGTVIVRFTWCRSFNFFLLVPSEESQRVFFWAVNESQHEPLQRCSVHLLCASELFVFNHGREP